MKGLSLPLLASALLGSSCLILAVPTSNPKSFSSVVIFGDSYTDQGVYQYRPDSNGEVAEPGTYLSTGGRVWPQYIGQYTGVNIYDYAISGAVCDATFAPSPRKGVKQNQIPSFLADNEYVNSTSGKGVLYNPPSETIYAIWIGTNDIGNRAFLTELQPDGMPITAYTDCVFEQLDRLYAVGARRFVLMNIAPLHLSPQYARPENGGVESSQFWMDKAQYSTNLTRISEKIRQYSTLLNAVYEYQIPYEVVIARRYHGSQFALYDVHSLMTDIWNHPSSYLNGTAPLNVTGFVSGCLNSSCTSRSSWDSYMWYDELHPSEQTDRVIAREFVDVVVGNSKWATYWNHH
ncbi:GDSL lipase/esterase [Aspergillus granulosus]|uniref:GDSL lipase/esterase n=1 Tax=Aspergillus granulosus TaxID=176169 RepID=A0ABR4H8P1_9EURO